MRVGLTWCLVPYMGNVNWERHRVGRALGLEGSSIPRSYIEQVGKHGCVLAHVGLVGEMVCAPRTGAGGQLYTALLHRAGGLGWMCVSARGSGG